jgi:predicted metalloprotease with PDZ domain
VLTPSRRPLLLALAATLAACASAPLPAPPPPAPRAPDWTEPTASAAPAPPPVASRQIEITLAPQRDPAGTVTSLDVAIRLSEPPGEFGDASPLTLTLEESEQGEAGWPDAIEEVYARDGEGALALKTKSATVDGEARTEWRSDRHPSGAIVVTYRVRIAPVDSHRYQGIHAHAGGFEGLGSTFLLLPDVNDVYRAHVVWSLAGAGDAAQAVSSFGTGDSATAGPLDRLRSAFYMAGPVGRLALDDGPTHFRGAWLGRPLFDPTEAAVWAARARDGQRAFFRDTDPAPFTFFLRPIPGLGASWVGNGGPSSFLLLAGDKLPWSRLARFAVAHELTHAWIGVAGSGVRFDGPEGSSYWFTEGFTVHYTRALLLRDGLATPAEFLDDLRERTERFVVNPDKALPNEAIVKGFFKSNTINKLPYDRGMLYAAEVDAAIRARSGGKRSLDDLVLGLLESARSLGKAAAAGDPGAKDAVATAVLPAGAFRERIGVELGLEGQARYDAVIVRGEAPAPPSDAYGPCFKAAKKAIPRFELGFDVASYKENKVRGLVRGSAADRAGLREGDRVKGGEALIGITFKKVIVIVERDGKEKTIEFLPQGATVDGSIWVRDPKVPDTACVRR